MTSRPARRLRVLVAAPLPADVGAVAGTLGGAGHEVVTAYRLDDAIARLVADRPDVAVVDPALAVHSAGGTTDAGAAAGALAAAGAVGRLRGHGDAPILVLADVDDEAVVGAALDAGASDVIGRPIRPLELLARVAAAGRRSGATAGLGVPTDGPGDLPDGLRVDVGGRRAEVAGRPLALTPIELDLLAAIASRRGGLVDHRLLVRAAWSDPVAVDPETLRAHLGRLNAKLVAAGHPGLRNVRSRGYGLRVEGSLEGTP